jgi:hypothetical protein
MKIFYLLLAAVALITAAPTTGTSEAKTYKTSVLDGVLDDLCFDMSQSICSDVVGENLRYGVLDLANGNGLCACKATPSPYIVSSPMSKRKRLLTSLKLDSRCPGLVCPSDELMHIDAFSGECFCAVDNGYVNAAPQKVSFTTGFLDGSLSRNALRVEKSINDLFKALDVWKSLGPNADEHFEVTQAVQSVLFELQALTSKIRATNIKMQEHAQVLVKQNNERRELTSTFTVSNDPAASTFLPPQKTDITPALINQSISTQPDNTGLVTGAIPVFQDGVVTFLVQLVGPVAPIIPINCSTSLPCGYIGNGPDPNIIIGPKYIEDGSTQTTVADCIVIAVNMYQSGVLSWVIQNNKGEIYSLVGSIKIHDLNKIDVGAPMALSLQSSPTWNKRTVDEPASYVIPKRYQVYKSECDVKSTSLGYFFSGLDDYCGCMDLEGAGSLYSRSGISVPDVTEATMSAEACAAMTCINNGGKPAVFNPFSLTCWCIDEAYVENNPSGWTGRVAKLIRKFI